MHKMKYVLLGAEREFETLFSLSDDEGRWAAQEAAEHFYDYHGGSEKDWPLEFRLTDESGETAVFSVEIDYLPTFHATKKKGES